MGFDACIQQIITSLINDESLSLSLEIREMSLQLINSILQQKVNVRMIYSYKTKLINTGTVIINKKGSLDDDEEMVDAIDNVNAETVQEEDVVAEEQQNQSTNL